MAPTVPETSVELSTLADARGATASGQASSTTSLPQRPTALHLPGLSVKPFWPLHAFPWAGELEAVTDDSNREFQALLERSAPPTPSVATSTLGSATTSTASSALLLEGFGGGGSKQSGTFDDLQPGWRTWSLLEEGRWHPNARRCRKTVEALLRSPLGVGCCLFNAYFSRLTPGTEVRPHCAATNAKLRGQLVLWDGSRRTEGYALGDAGAASDCASIVDLALGGLLVGEERRTWRAGELLVFDDSVWHSAVLPESCAELLVLVFDFWHPEVTEEQRQQILENFPASWAVGSADARNVKSIPSAVGQPTATFHDSILCSDGCLQGLIQHFSHTDLGRFQAACSRCRPDILWRGLCWRDGALPPRDSAAALVWASWYHQHYINNKMIVDSSKEMLALASASGDPTVKICLFGPTCAGKTGFSLRLRTQSFPDSFPMTIGLDFHIFQVRCQGRWVRVQLWDSSGPEGFGTTNWPYHRIAHAAHAILCCFDVGDPQSLHAMEHTWLRQFDEEYQRKTMILGLKSDLVLETGSNTLEEGRRLPEEFQVPFATASSKEGVNVERALGQCLKDMVLASLPPGPGPLPPGAAQAQAATPTPPRGPERRCVVQ